MSACAHKASDSAESAHWAPTRSAGSRRKTGPARSRRASRITRHEQDALVSYSAYQQPRWAAL